MRRLLLALLLLTLAAPALAQTTYYVDPDYAGTSTGSASQPWQSLSDSGAWTAINSALASGAVTVYFSAREAGSDTNEASTTDLIVLRTDASANRLTLDGMSYYNTNDSSPSWSAYAGTRKFQITSGWPISTNDLAARSNVTVKGFRVISTALQAIYWHGGNNVIIEDNEISHTAAATIGSGIYFQYTYDEGQPFCPTANTRQTCVAYTNLTIQRNYIHDNRGEGLYIGGCAVREGVATTCISHDGVNILNNTIGPGLSVYGGEADGIDLKGGLRNVVVRGNTVILDPDTASDGIVTESGGLYERNFINGAGRAGINLSDTYLSTPTRDGTIVRNNVIVNSLGRSIFAGTGIRVTCNAIDPYSNAKLQNNTIYHIRGTSNQATGISSGCTGETVQNNLISDVSGVGGSYGWETWTGTQTAHTNNTFHLVSGGALAYVHGEAIYTSGDILGWEATALWSDPLFVSTAAPYAALNFALQAASPAKDSGATIATFTDDYSGNTRSGTWDRGALEYGPGGSKPNAPTNVRIR